MLVVTDRPDRPVLQLVPIDCKLAGNDPGRRLQAPPCLHIHLPRARTYEHLRTSTPTNICSSIANACVVPTLIQPAGHSHREVPAPEFCRAWRAPAATGVQAYSGSGLSDRGQPARTSGRCSFRPVAVDMSRPSCGASDIERGTPQAGDPPPHEGRISTYDLTWCWYAYIVTLLVVCIVTLFVSLCNTGDSVQFTLISVHVASCGSGGGNDGYGALNLTFTVAARNPNRGLGVRYEHLGTEVWYRDRMVADGAIQGFKVPRHSTRWYRVPVTVPVVDWELAADMAYGVVPLQARFTARYQTQRVQWVCDISVRVTQRGAADSAGALLAANCYSTEVTAI